MSVHDSGVSQTVPAPASKGPEPASATAPSVTLQHGPATCTHAGSRLADDPLAGQLARVVRRRTAATLARAAAEVPVAADRPIDPLGEVKLALKPLGSASPPDPREGERIRERFAGGPLWDMWLAAAGLEPAAAGSRDLRSATPEERLARFELAADRDTHHRFNARLGKPGPALTADLQAYYAVINAARRRIAQQGVTAIAHAPPQTPVVASPGFDVEHQREAVRLALEAIKRVTVLQGVRLATTNVTRFTPETTRLLKAKADSLGPGKLQDALRMKLPQSVYAFKGALSTLDLILRVADEKKRRAMLQSFARENLADVTVRDLSGDLVVVAQVCESAMTVGGLAAYVDMLARGLEKEAGDWFKWMTAQKPATGDFSPQLFRTNFLAGEAGLLSLRTLSWIAAGAQVLYSVAVLLDEKSTDSDRLSALWGLGLGGAGLAGTAFTGLNIELLAGVSGWLTAALLILGAAGAGARHVVRAGEEQETTAATAKAFKRLEESSAEVVEDLNALLAALALDLPLAQRSALADIVAANRPHAGSGRPRRPVTDEPTAEEAAAARRQAARRASALRRTLERVLRECSDFPSSQGWFDDVSRDLAAARTPVELRDIALRFLLTVRDLFRHFERTVARRLREEDRHYMKRNQGDWLLLFRGLHDELKEKAAEGRSNADESDRGQYGRD